MIRNLRKRIVAINVIFASIILFVAVILIFALGYRRIDAERVSRMRSALHYNPQTAQMRFEDNDLFGDIALVFYNNTTQSIENLFLGEKCDLSAEKLDGYVIRALASTDNSDMVSYSVRFVKMTEGNVTKIAFTSLTSRQNSLLPYAFSALGSLLLGLCCYLLISVQLAKIALKPVEESWKKQKQFVADASHELKTPISVIMANTDILASHAEETVQSQMKWITNTRDEAQRMAGLVADLLFLAKNDDGLQVAMEDLDLSDCVNNVVLGYEVLFYEKNKSFAYDIGKNIRIEGNSGQIKQLVTILLDNASKYSLEAGNVSLTLSATPKQAQLVVSNDCEQLTDEQLAHIFDRFYTVDPSRNKNNGGNGLGLAIAKTICETHNGEIAVSCQENRITFEVTLPIKKQK